jgi:peptidoglycan/LPS O-acetylase OafA/YrhL
VSPGVKDRWKSFDALRGWAMLLVFLFHYSGFASPYTPAGAACDMWEWLCVRIGTIGTNLFLLLSGLFVARSVAHPAWNYGKYVLARLVRLYSVYLIVLAGTILAGFAFPAISKLTPAPAGWEDLLGNLILLPGLFPSSPVVTVSWILPIVLAGYLLLPVLLRPLYTRVRSPRLRLAIWAISGAGYFTLSIPFSTEAFRATYLIAGCAIYELLPLMPGQRAARKLAMCLVAVFCSAMLIRLLVQAGGAGRVFSGLALRAVVPALGILGLSALAVLALLAQKCHAPMLASVPATLMSRAGRLTYSFYLLHGPVVKIFALALFPALASLGASALWYWLLMPFCLSVAALAAAGSYLAVERPCASWLQQRRFRTT